MASWRMDRKSTLATALIERVAEKGLGFCVFDPEGDYSELENAVSFGDAKTPPRIDQAIDLLIKAHINVAIDTESLSPTERPAFFANLLPRLCSLRTRTGRPHWLIIDEAHHLMPARRKDLPQVLPEEIPATVFITVHPEEVSSDVLKRVDVVLALGPSALDVLSAFGNAIGVQVPAGSEAPNEDEVLIWHPRSGKPSRRIKPIAPRQLHRRHTRKYAEGDLGEDLSFYFRGPDKSLNLQAQNLQIFEQIAKGIDDRTWEHHLRAVHYSRWFRDVIKDEELAREAHQVEVDARLNAQESRRLIVDAINRRYTAPARGG